MGRKHLGEAAMRRKEWSEAKAAHERRDYVIELQLYQKMADEGDARAQANLGVMYEHGHGAPQDLVEAEMWYILSASCFRASEAKSRGLVIRNRDQLAAKMTPVQLARARRRAREWRPG